jgi:tetratricopeptide (TPR) repeat protein
VRITDVHILAGLGAILVALFSSSAVGHESPDHVVQSLTDRIETDGPNARLLLARAYEYQSAGDLRAAAVDFKAVLLLNPHSSAALGGLAEILLQQNELSDAAETARRGLVLNAPGRERFHALLARSLTRQECWTQALESWSRALESPQPEIAWFIGEAECLFRLSRYPEQVAALAAAKSRNPSVVLHRAWIHALVDAGLLDEASRQIERGLTESRWRSSWLLLRARLHERNHRTAEQQADAAAALSELKLRLNSSRPDLQLVADVGYALAILNRRDEALAQLAAARRLGASEVTVARLDRMLHVTVN